MASSEHSTNPRQLPVLYHPKPGKPDLAHHTTEWTSGSRGGGSLPADFEWGTNPKQHQEERGSAEAEKPIS